MRQNVKGIKRECEESMNTRIHASYSVKGAGVWRDKGVLGMSLGIEDDSQVTQK